MNVHIPLGEWNPDPIDTERLIDSESDVALNELSHKGLLNPEVHRELE